MGSQSQPLSPSRAAVRDVLLPVTPSLVSPCRLFDVVSDLLYRG
jgi:hypothetical protein